MSAMEANSVISSTSGAMLLAGMGCGLAIGWLLRGRAPPSTAGILGTSSPAAAVASPARSVQNSEGALQAALQSNPFEEYKMVLVVRTDLKMGKGKAAAQCCHAAVACCQKLMRSNPRVLSIWEDHGQPKVVVKTESEADLVQLATKAREAGLQTYLVSDAGRTQIPTGSKTVLGVGPGPAKVVDSVTSHLKLY
eukprot:scpid41363/ scgid6435/ Peptidyl-tRNA hydrolase 2, mitochondrial; Bcl-2 inhibitor of transcription